VGAGAIEKNIAMQHSYRAEGFGARLRPVRMEDAAYIVWLRNLEHAKGRLGDSAKDVAAQEAWLKDYFGRPGDYYFIIETRGGTPAGAYGIYNVTGTSAESGRWVIQPEIPAAIPSAVLAFDLAFGELGLTELRAKTVSTNQPVLSLNKKFGFCETRVEKGSQFIDGKSVDQIHFLMKAEEWTRSRSRLLPLAEFAATQIAEWEAARKNQSKS
jgi:RimJ/RimL family protein N-acetyltransferase